MITKTLSEQVTKLANKMQKENQSLRWGQALFNALHEIDSKLADEISTTLADPFYNEENLGNFYAAIQFYEIGYKKGLDIGLENPIL